MNWRVSLIVLACGLAGVAAAEGTKAPPVVEISAATLAGKELEETNPEAFRTPHIQVREPQGQPPGGMSLIFEGKLNVAVFEINGGRNHFDYFLGDEFVLVLAGAVTLTTDTTHRVQTFRKGERFLVPQGWQGDWKPTPDYRELASVSDAWFAHLGDTWQPARPPAADLEVSRVTKQAFGKARNEARSFSRSDLNNGHDLRVSLLRGKAGATLHVRAMEHGQQYQLTSGTLTVVPADGSAKRQLQTGSHFILTESFEGDLTTESGFECLVVEPGK